MTTTRTHVRETLTALGVILSLVFVALEIRANTNAVKGATMQAIADQAAGSLIEASGVPEIRSGIVKASSGDLAALTSDEVVALSMLYSAGMRMAENRFRQVRLGILAPDETISPGTSYENPFFAVFWEANRAAYPDDFRAYVEAELLPQVRDSVRLLPR